MPKSITYDTHAIRNGDPAAGWIVILSWTEIRDEEQDVLRFDTDNKLFPTQQDATNYVQAISSSYDVTIKAVRAAVCTTATQVRQGDRVRFTDRGLIRDGIVVQIRPEPDFNGELGVTILWEAWRDQPGMLFLVKPDAVTKLP